MAEAAARIEAFVLDVDGVLSNGLLHYGEGGELMKSFHVRDGLGLALLRDRGVRCAILSGRNSPVVAARAAELGIEPCLLGRIDKGTALAEIAGGWGLPLERLAAIGDDLVDLPMLRAVGLSFAPADADPRVRAVADVVCPSDGGQGAVRDACEHILRLRGDWAHCAARFGLDETRG